MSIFFNNTATTEIYTLSLHDALPILTLDALSAARKSIYIEAQYMTAPAIGNVLEQRLADPDGPEVVVIQTHEDRKSTRLNSSHANISYAVFCLKKKT